MTRSVIVIGAGVAGVAATWSARRRGVKVTLVSKGAGASSLGGGAVDDGPWERIARAARDLGTEPIAGELDADVVNFSSALGLWTLPAPGMPRPRLATVAGLVRPARGYDRALLNLELLRGTTVLLPRVDRAGWDADAIAAGLSDDPFSRSRELRFVAVDAPILRFLDEARIADADLAARHDDDARLGWLGERLREAVVASEGSGIRVGGVLLGPWLGVEAPRSEELSARAGLPVGEAVMGVGSPAGHRFASARERLLKALGVTIEIARATSVSFINDRALVACEGEAAPLEADAVILALGGLTGGGVVYAPPDSMADADLPPRAAVPFTLSLSADVTLGAREGALGVTSSLHGPELDLSAWPSGDRPGLLEEVGILCRGAEAAPGILAAGDVVAGRSRTLLEGVASGVRAGRSV
ncbi:MAG TPA: FAD-dependent oxidoreductase [Polyangiaceae bacterium]|nr:FAD-dependent oxidoreductase [Polyangiaceae bacterium]